jgi:transcriptional regulator with XRE-family HTH domain/quercetin dioxygenase-like cupin family protein
VTVTLRDVEVGDIGVRLREERERVGISQRELARRLGVSASLISQIESGQSKPSVGTLYAVVTELGVSLDHVFRVHELPSEVVDGAGGGKGSAVEDATGGDAGLGPVVRPEERHVIDLASGVRWERLTSHRHEDVDFLHVVYDVGGASAVEGSMMRHAGREYGFVVSGVLGVQLEFERHEMRAGDSIAFDSTTPHRLWNAGDEPVHGIWFVVGREGERRSAP